MRLLDTSICIFLIRRRPPHMIDRLRVLDIESVGISSITLAELEYGVWRSAQPERNRDALAAFVAPLAVLPFDDAAAARYGAVRAEIEREGQPIGGLDMLIAAHALALGRTLVTNSVWEFRRVRGLAVEDWG